MEKSAGKIVAIHQPNFIPWIGYYHKIASADCFVFLDTVEFTKGGFINRNKIKFSNAQADWLTIPVKISKSARQKINEVPLNRTVNWKEKHLKTLATNYSKAQYFNRYFPKIEAIYQREFLYISNFNIELSRFILRALDIKTELRIASEIDIDHELKSNELLVEVCRACEANIYLSGSGAKKYNDENLFEHHGIQLTYQDFTHPVYPQLYGEFISHLSILDLLFNCGPDSIKRLKNR